MRGIDYRCYPPNAHERGVVLVPSLLCSSRASRCSGLLTAGARGTGHSMPCNFHLPWRDQCGGFAFAYLARPLTRGRVGDLPAVDILICSGGGGAMGLQEELSQFFRLAFCLIVLCRKRWVLRLLSWQLMNAWFHYQAATPPVEGCETAWCAVCQYAEIGNFVREDQ